MSPQLFQFFFHRDLEKDLEGCWGVMTFVEIVPVMSVLSSDRASPRAGGRQGFTRIHFRDRERRLQG